jgi:uncharacterized protein YukE
MIDNPLLTLAHAILDGVMGEVNKQIQSMENEVMSPLQNFVKEVAGGVWQGPDAEKFMSDVSNLVPKIQESHQFTSSFATGIVNAAQQIVQADAKAAQQVADLVGQFSKIF